MPGDVRTRLKRPSTEQLNIGQIGRGIRSYVPSSVLASKSYCKSRLMDALTMSLDLVKPTFLGSHNEYNWPDLQAFIHQNPQIQPPTATTDTYTSSDSPVGYTVASIIAYMRRWELSKTHVLNKHDGPFCKVTAYWWRYDSKSLVPFTLTWLCGAIPPPLCPTASVHNCPVAM